MTIYQLLEYDDPDMLAKFTDAELNEWFKPYLEVTRPELAKVNTSDSVKHSSSGLRSKRAQEQLELDRRMEMVRQMAKERGIKM